MRGTRLEKWWSGKELVVVGNWVGRVGRYRSFSVADGIMKKKKLAGRQVTEYFGGGGRGRGEGSNLWLVLVLVLGGDFDKKVGASGI